MYSVAKCIYELSDGTNTNGWVIESDDDTYPFYANKYLHYLTISSDQTCKQYAYRLCRYMNYLLIVYKTDYLHSTQDHLNHFVDFIVYGGSFRDDTIVPSLSGNTIQLYSTVISGFYNYLYKIGVSFELSVLVKEVGPNKYSFFYGQNHNTKRTKVIINDAFSRSTKKHRHIKWYTYIIQ